MEKIIVIRISANVCGDYNDDGNYECDGKNDVDLSQEVFDIKDAAKEKWFHDLLRESGFYHNNDIVDGTQYTDKFVYDVCHGSNCRPTLYKNLSDVSSPHNASIASVYQEVVGPERLEQVKEFEKLKETYDKRMKSQAKKDAEKKKLAALFSDLGEKC